MSYYRAKKTAGGSYIVATMSIALVLIILGSLVYIGLNSMEITNHVRKNIGFTIILKEGSNNAEIKKFQNILKKKNFVEETYFISKEEAAAAFKKAIGEDFESVLGYNPLLPSIEIKLNPRYANNDSLNVIEKQLTKYNVVKEVAYQKSFVEMLNRNMKRIGILLSIAAIALALISFTLIRNTIHLSVYSQRFLIKTMQLVGAKTSFICKPFMRNSIYIGFLAGCIATALLIGIIYFIQKKAEGMISLMRYDILIIMGGTVIVSGIVLSFLFSWLSVMNYINKDHDRLYK